MKIPRLFIDRFETKYSVNLFSGCWEWQAALNREGYGEYAINRKTFRAHRVSFMIHKGDIPEGLYVCHTCDNTVCVNPEHLFLGTQADNMRDRNKKGRANMPQGEKMWCAKLTDENIKEIRKLAKTTRFTQEMLAKEFGVSGRSISGIISRQTWKHVT